MEKVPWPSNAFVCIENIWWVYWQPLCKEKNSQKSSNACECYHCASFFHTVPVHWCINHLFRSHLDFSLRYVRKRSTCLHACDITHKFLKKYLKSFVVGSSSESWQPPWLTVIETLVSESKHAWKLPFMGNKRCSKCYKVFRAPTSSSTSTLASTFLQQLTQRIPIVHSVLFNPPTPTVEWWMSNLWPSVIIILRSRCALLLRPRGSIEGSSVKDCGWPTWIIRSCCCLLAIDDVPMLPWCWIKHDDAGEALKWHGQLKGQCGHTWWIWVSQNSTCHCSSPLCFWEVCEPALYSKLSDTTSNTFFAPQSWQRLIQKKCASWGYFQCPTLRGLISQKTTQRLKPRQL